MSSFECFVVMPFGFGAKPFPDASGRLYDFDKVYRAIIQRAIREAAMTPVRADERLSCAIVHGEMFRDLRDRRVVLADLSLDNPNVFYELGIRHVMSSTGTVLMCRKGSILPFDVKLSRVIFYDFDGSSLDWEEVERAVSVLKIALTQAYKGQPDSPVHALLETVIRERERGARISGERVVVEKAPDGEPAEPYQQIVADAWRLSGETVESLFEQHRGSAFGSRALAYLCLKLNCTEAVTQRLANHLNDGQQYRLANQLYKLLDDAGLLTGDQGAVYDAVFSSDGAQILTASADKTAKLWDAATGKLIATFVHQASVYHGVFSPDGARILTASADNTARLWDAVSGKLIASFDHQDSVRWAAFSPDGARILTASWDKTAKLWDAATPVALSIVASGLKFSDDGSLVAVDMERRSQLTRQLEGLAQSPLPNARERNVLKIIFVPPATGNPNL